jgi:hypothetical protein
MHKIQDHQHGLEERKRQQDRRVRDIGNIGDRDFDRRQHGERSEHEQVVRVLLVLLAWMDLRHRGST